MGFRTLPLLLCMFFVNWFALVQADDFFAGDQNTTFTNPPGLGAGDSITFQGVISAAAGDGVLIDPVPSGLTLTFTNTSMTMSGPGEDGVDIDDSFDGAFTNRGQILGYDDGVDIDGDLSGGFFNHGTIRGLGDNGVEIEGDLIGDFTNWSVIQGDDDGVDIDFNVAGNLMNYGLIQGGGRTESTLSPSATVELSPTLGPFEVILTQG